MPYYNRSLQAVELLRRWSVATHAFERKGIIRHLSNVFPDYMFYTRGKTLKVWVPVRRAGKICSAIREHATYIEAVAQPRWSGSKSFGRQIKGTLRGGAPYRGQTTAYNSFSTEVVTNTFRHAGPMRDDLKMIPSATVVKEVATTVVIPKKVQTIWTRLLEDEHFL